MNLGSLDLLHMTLPKTMRRNGSFKENEKRVKKTRKRSKQTLLPLYKNPWDFTESIPLLEEDMMLSKDDLMELECRLNYSIRCLSEKDTGKAEFLYKIFGEQVGKSQRFMRNCVRMYSVTNRDQLESISKEYLDSTGSKVTTWLQGVKEGRNGDLLTLFMLSLITRVHCCVHLKENNYWTTLKEVPTTHAEFMQRCNVHLAYLGKDIFIELVLRTATVSYKVFGIDQPLDLVETAPAVIGTLTSAESSTLDMLMKLEKASSDSLNPDNDETLKNLDTQETVQSSCYNMTKEDINVDEKQDLISHVHDDCDDTILYDYTMNIEDNPNPKSESDADKTSSNIATPSLSDHPAVTKMDKIYDGSDPPKEKDMESIEKVTPATTAETELGIQKHYE